MERPEFDLPSEAALDSLMGDLNKAMANLPKTQERLMSLTAEAWSEDGLVRAEVGPRGQLIDLQIDPRIFRRPDSQALRASIMEAVTAAVRAVNLQAQEVIFGEVPPEVAELRAQFQPDGDDPISQMLRTDADLMAERRRK